MRITLINQFYPPDLSPTARLAASLASHRAALGDEVTVIAGCGYSDRVHERCSPSRNGVVVQRAWNSRMGRSSHWRRCVDYGAFAACAAWRVARLPRQDLLICLSTPPFVGTLGVLHKLLHRETRLILWSMDCYPEVIERAGMITPDGPVSRGLQLWNRLLARRTDHVVCLDEAMRTLVLSRHDNGTYPSEISVLPNWEAIDDYSTMRRNRNYDALTDGKFVVLYTGNLGYGHTVDTILHAAERWKLQGDAVQVVFTGGGVQVDAVHSEVRRKQLRNVCMLGHVSEDRVQDLQRAAGVSLVTLKDEMLGVMCPSKLHASLAVGTPVAYLGPRGGNVDEAVNRFDCGVSLRNGDVDGLVDFVERLRSQPLVHAGYRRRARRAFEDAYCDRKTLPVFDQIIDECVRPVDQSDGKRRSAA